MGSQLNYNKSNFQLDLLVCGAIFAACEVTKNMGIQGQSHAKPHLPFDVHHSLEAMNFLLKNFLDLLESEPQDVKRYDFIDAVTCSIGKLSKVLL
jgi:hypothetical protein